MRRIGLAVTVALGLFATMLTATAQRPTKVSRIGVLASFPRAQAVSATHPYNAFLQELRDLGYIEGQNVIIEWRYTEGKTERRRREAAALVEWKPDVVLTVSGGDALALRDVGANVPIVVAGGGDLVAIGLVDSLARPRSNVTGLQVLQIDLAPKRLQILKELIPRLQRVALLHETPGGHAGDPFYAQLLATLDTAGKTLAVRVRRFALPTEDELDRVFADMKRDSEAVIVVATPFMTVQLPRLVELAVRHRLPTMHDLRSYVEA